MIIQSIAKVARTALGKSSFVGEEERAYRRLSAMGFRPSGIVDVGAYEGNWTRLARRVFPHAPIRMVEPQESKRAVLEATCAALNEVSYVNAVLGERAGESVKFYEMETGSSMMPENSNVPRIERSLITSTLDEIADDVPGPLFLKIDVQGAELRVLEGAAETLDRCEIVQLEVAMLPYNKGAPSFLKTIAYMDDRGFVPLDFSGFTRPNGRDLVQVDILFTKRASSWRPNFFQF
ncbi:FkbM family methyltransferase [Tsuneonella sp. HG249]